MKANINSVLAGMKWKGRCQGWAIQLKIVSLDIFQNFVDNRYINIFPFVLKFEKVWVHEIKHDLDKTAVVTNDKYQLQNQHQLKKKIYTVMAYCFLLNENKKNIYNQ